MRGAITVKTIFTLVLAVAAAAAAAVAVLQVVRGSSAGSADRPSPPDSMQFSEQGDRWAGGFGRPAASSSTRPSGVEGMLDPGGGLQVLARDPAGVPAPEGARRLSDFVHELPGARQEHGRYAVGKSADVLESFYRSTMPRAGWREVRRPDAAGGAGLTFVRSTDQCVIWIESAGDGCEVRVVVTLSTD